MVIIVFLCVFLLGRGFLLFLFGIWGWDFGFWGWGFFFFLSLSCLLFSFLTRLDRFLWWRIDRLFVVFRCFGIITWTFFLLLSSSVCSSLVSFEAFGRLARRFFYRLFLFTFLLDFFFFRRRRFQLFFLRYLFFGLFCCLF